MLSSLENFRCLIFRQCKTTTCHIQWTQLTGYFIECRLQEGSYWLKQPPITGYAIERRTAGKYKLHASTEPIENKVIKIHLLNIGYKYKCHIRVQNLTDLGELSNSTKETKIRKSFIREKSRFIQELELMAIINR
ncbi:unnamed protein product [Rotaria sordida]|uniref:Uncharacterized protein n=1 Tax=Rotaria sordida TaxID=392033 RepID=A0A815REV3_9BILA|nr:unnamed protein product [Rotaria sordida]